MEEAELADPEIFVSIASYRDPELQWTLRDLFRKARNPERVSVGICWQFISPDDDPHFSVQTRPDRVQVRAYDARVSQGAGWARTIAHGLRRDEPYVLQVDSHMRFHQGWDDHLLYMLAQCPSDRPVLSTYPPAYEPAPGGGEAEMRCGSFVLRPRGFDGHGMLTFEGHEIRSAAPVPCPWLAGGLMFGPAEFFLDVPYDPKVYFIGEEVSLAVRGWTNGWDYFAPHECVAHHYYGRSTSSKHWSDHRSWTRANDVSMSRVRHVLRMSSEPRSLTDALDGPLGLGSDRSLEDFQRFAGVDFRRRVILPTGAGR